MVYTQVQLYAVKREQEGVIFTWNASLVYTDRTIRAFLCPSVHDSFKTVPLWCLVHVTRELHWSVGARGGGAACYRALVHENFQVISRASCIFQGCVKKKNSVRLSSNYGSLGTLLERTRRRNDAITGINYGVPQGYSAAWRTDFRMKTEKNESWLSITVLLLVLWFKTRLNSLVCTYR